MGWTCISICWEYLSALDIIFLMSHNLIAWSFPLDMKLRPSPRLSICVIPCKCPVKTPAACPVDKQRLSHTCRLQRSDAVALMKWAEFKTSNIFLICSQGWNRLGKNPEGWKYNHWHKRNISGLMCWFRHLNQLSWIELNSETSLIWSLRVRASELFWIKGYGPYNP